MNDRELLELAAKAAGYDLRWVSTRLDDNFTARIRNDNPYWFNWPTWSPLTDDGDALRLAVRLELTVATGIRYCTVTGAHAHVNEPYDGDPTFGGAVVTATSAMAATRRAIVRAAAAMAKTTA